MKKIIMRLAILLIAVMILCSFVACESPEEGNMGTFYDLQEAYDERFLTVDDLEIIADYNNNSIPYPDALSQFVVEKIKKAFVKKLQTGADKPSWDVTASDVSISNYYGTYNDSVVVIITYGYHIDLHIPVSITIDGVTFNFSYPYEISVWREINKS